MSSSFPTGWFHDDLLLWGEFPGETACFARGGLLEVPDVRHADARTVLELVAQNALFLATNGDATAFQVQWTMECDFAPVLAHHRGTRRAGTAWSRRTGEVRLRYFEARHAERSLRRERVYLYFGRRCRDLAGAALGTTRERASYVRQIAAELDNRWRSLRDVFRAGRTAAFGDAEHCIHLRKFLNPSVSAGFFPIRRKRRPALTSPVPSGATACAATFTLWQLHR